MCNKTKNKNKKYFSKYCLQCFSSEKVLIEHKKICLIINDKQSVKLKSGSISFRNYFKQIRIPCKIYADFECLFKGVKISNKNSSSYTEKYQDHVPCSFAYKIVCVNNKFSKKVVLYRGKYAVYKFIKTILKEYNYCRQVIKNHFNKNLVIPAEEETFQITNSCCICDKLFDVGDNKVRDYCHITSNVNLKLSKRVPVIFTVLARSKMWEA